MDKIELHEWLSKNRVISLTDLINVIAQHSDKNIEHIESWVFKKVCMTPECVQCNLASPVATKYFEENGGLKYTHIIKEGKMKFVGDHPFPKDLLDSLPGALEAPMTSNEQVHCLRLIKAMPSDISLCHIVFEILNNSVDNAIMEILSSDTDHSFDYIPDNDLYKHVVFTKNKLWNKNNGLYYVNKGKYENEKLNETYNIKVSEGRIKWILSRELTKGVIGKNGIVEEKALSKLDAEHIDAVTTPTFARRRGNRNPK